MPTLPSPIPHPLSFLDAPGWLRDALEYVVGTQWPEGNEKAMRALADEWAGAARRMGPLLDDSDRAALEAVAAFGGPEGQAAQALLTLWRRLGGGPEASLVKVSGLFDDLGQLVNEAANEIEAVKLEFYIELLLMLAELLILVATVAISAGASLVGAGPIILATRMAIQRLLRKAAQNLLEKSAKKLLRGKVLDVKSGMGGFVLKTAGIQAHQANQSHRSSVDSGDMLRSFGIGIPAGGVSNLTALGGVRATGALGKFGERGLRGVSGEILGEVTVGVVTGQAVSWQDLAMASTSGTYGTSVDAPLHPMRERLDALQADLLASASVSVDPASSTQAPSSVSVVASPSPDVRLAADPTQTGAHPATSANLQATAQTAVSTTQAGPVALSGPLASGAPNMPAALLPPAGPAVPTTPAAPSPPTVAPPPPSAPTGQPVAPPQPRGGDALLLAPIPGPRQPDIPSGNRNQLPGMRPDEQYVRREYEARVRYDIQERIKTSLRALVDEILVHEEDIWRRGGLYEQLIDALTTDDIDSIKDELWEIANAASLADELQTLGRDPTR